MKLDTQNPVVGELLKETQENKLDKDFLNEFLSVKDVETGERLTWLKRFNDGNNNNDDNCRPQLPLNFFFNRPNKDDDDMEDDDDNWPPPYDSLPSTGSNMAIEKDLTPTQTFLLGDEL